MYFTSFAGSKTRLSVTRCCWHLPCCSADVVPKQKKLSEYISSPTIHNSRQLLRQAQFLYKSMLHMKPVIIWSQDSHPAHQRSDRLLLRRIFVFISLQKNYMLNYFILTFAGGGKIYFKTSFSFYQIFPREAQVPLRHLCSINPGLWKPSHCPSVPNAAQCAVPLPCSTFCLQPPMSLNRSTTTHKWDQCYYWWTVNYHHHRVTITQHHWQQLYASFNMITRKTHWEKTWALYCTFLPHYILHASRGKEERGLIH